MAEEGKRRNLGRGLSALLGEESEDYAELDRLRVSKLVPIDEVRPGRYQPRHRIDDDSIRDLAQSIRQKGILQPLLVRRHPDEANVFEIITGERRWRAAQMAEVHQVPVIIKDLSDQETLEVALVENLQRQDLSPLEEAEGYRQLMDEFSHTQELLAKAVGKSRSHVANTMRLLSLPDPVKKMLDAGVLSAGHARALLNAADPVGLARKVAKGDLNVRQTERLVKGKGPGAKPGKPAPPKDADTIALERDLETLLGLKVEIKFRGKDGSLTIHYESLDQLDDILHRLSRGAFLGKAAGPDAGQAGGAQPGQPLVAAAGEQLVALDIGTDGGDQAPEAETLAGETLDADRVPLEGVSEIDALSDAVEAALSFADAASGGTVESEAVIAAIEAGETDAADTPDDADAVVAALEEEPDG